MCELASLVLVPKTPVYKNRYFAGRKHQVGLARKGMPMQPIPISSIVEHATHQPLGFCVFSSNPPHPLAAFLRCERVSHFTPNFAKTSDFLDFSPHSLVEIVGPI